MKYFIYFFACAGLVTSQFYLLPSGLPQFSHFLLLIFCILTVFSIPRFGSAVLTSDSKIVFFLLSFFGVYVFTVNAIFSLLLGDYRFNLFSVYLFYNALIFVCFYEFLVFFRGAKRILGFSLVCSLLFLFGLYVFGFGRYDFSPRYNGYFNDPNQTAFWVLCLCSIYFIAVKGRPVAKFFVFIISLVVVLATMSRSAMVGLVLTMASFVFSLLYSDGASRRVLIAKKAFAVFVLVSLSLVLYSFSIESDLSKSVISRFAEVDFSSQAEARGFIRVIEYPNYLIFGAGQGGDYRFGSFHEIHSTWIAFLFYYGVIGFSLFSFFVFYVGKGLGFSQFVAFLAPLAYSMSTFGARTPIFWVFMAVVLYFSRVDRED